MKKYAYILVLAGVLLFSVILIIPSIMTGMITVILGGEEEENQGTGEDGATYTVSLFLSEEVESYREDVLEEAKKQGMEAYIDLFLAVMQQESGGNGEDVFQASESKGLAPNSLSAEESIKQGVAYLSGMIKKAGCESPSDIPHIRLALQGYNFGGAYIDYAKKKDGKWTQNNTFSYAKKKSGGKRNTGTRKEKLGPWKYGDQYYTAHVLRYYPYTNETDSTGQSDDPVKIKLSDRMTWLFPTSIPSNELEMQFYLSRIEVPIYTKDKKKRTMTLTVHRKLAKEIKAVFEEMQKIKFPIDPTCTAGYCFRRMASDSSKLSYHSYGCVVDINWTHNGAPYTSWPYKPKTDKLAVNQKVVAIWKKHGFYWGGDWTGNSFDPMHFTYVNH